MHSKKEHTFKNDYDAALCRTAVFYLLPLKRFRETGLSLVPAAARRDRLGWRLENEDGEAQGYNSFVFQLHEISCGCTVNP